MNNLPKIVSRGKKRVGRGYGSGKGGHTSGRGQKGQKTRGSVNVMFEGVKVRKSLLHRVPMHRGKSKNKPRQKPVTVKLGELNKLKDGDKVNVESLIKAGILDRRDAVRGVKIVSGGKLEKKLTVEVDMSERVRSQVEKL